MAQLNIFAESNRYEKLSRLGDNLEKLNSAIDWEMFRPVIESAIRKGHKGKAGRPPYDSILLFKIVVLQRYFNLSDDQTEYQINDRMSFIRFLGLTLSDRVPDAKTIWLFKDRLAKLGVMDELFDLFGSQLEEKHIITHTGTIVDATFVDAPRQHNTREENASIKKGEVPEGWRDDGDPKKRHRLSQKDVDARYAKKGGELHYGYKNHAKADAESKIITGYEVSDAAVHDSAMLSKLVDEGTDKVLYADSAYSGKELEASLPEGIEKHICNKGCRFKKLTDEQKKENRRISKTRCRIEHIFGFMTRCMNGITLRSIGICRARFNIALTNLLYNMCRLCTLQRIAKKVACQKG